MEDAKHGAGMRRYHFAGCSAITALANLRSTTYRVLMSPSGRIEVTINSQQPSYSTVTDFARFLG
jgi:hypothetical protein